MAAETAGTLSVKHSALSGPWCGGSFIAYPCDITVSAAGIQIVDVFSWVLLFMPPQLVAWIIKKKQVSVLTSADVKSLTLVKKPLKTFVKITCTTDGRQTTVYWGCTHAEARGVSGLPLFAGKLS